MQNFWNYVDLCYIADSAPRGCTGDEGMLLPRSRLAGAGFKTPPAALVKSHCRER
jgi:hypothetical protein